MHILMPVQTCRQTIDRLMQEHFDNAEPAYKSIALETVIDELAHYYGVSRQAAKTRMRQLGYNNVDGVYTYVNGHYIPTIQRRLAETRPIPSLQQICLRHTAAVKILRH